jgi:hypothetical protein
LISQIGVNYRNSSLSVGDDFKVKAGDRMPFFEVDGSSIYHRFREPSFHLVAFNDGKDRLPPLPDEVTSKWNGQIDRTDIPLYPHIIETFGSTSTFYTLLRPDNYIGLISSDMTGEAIRSYLDRFAYRTEARS